MEKTRVLISVPSSGSHSADVREQLRDIVHDMSKPDAIPAI